ncbi:MAG TPA: type IV pilus twitching motility protein PilT [Clostridiales bacterium]|jgi:twitching motility protein PilT|nr:type IV pilus twitching motility protein PilT [Clostridiales bacterium]HQP69730.1 type IV pilus twitching motility protein PilT [Clostridiales bacterium]
MSNIEKLLKMMIAKEAEKVVLNIGEPIYLVINGQKKILTQAPLSENELDAMKSECDDFFGDSSSFNFEGKAVKVGRTLNSIVFDSGKQPAAQAKASAQSASPQAKSSSAGSNEVAGAGRLQTEQQGGGINIDDLLRYMIENKASDLHICTGTKPMLRLDGDMIELDDFPEVTEDDMWPIINYVTPKKNIDEFKTTNDSDYAYEIEGLCRFRANIFRDHRGVGAVFRQIPFKILPPEVLKIPPKIIELCDLPKGLILVTGPTGSGKSTTLAALMDYVNRTYRKHIITIEDPVEFVHKNQSCLINQREVGVHTQSFKRALRAALREDPDVILVGEMRDLETISIAIEMAETGHLVFGTLHTNTAVGTVDRIIDQFPSNQQNQIRAMLADSLVGVVSQMLCKKQEGGRVAVYETLVVTSAVSNLIRECKNFQIPSIMEVGKQQGQKLMNESFMELIKDGTISIEEALDKAVDRNELIHLLQNKNMIGSVEIR